MGIEELLALGGVPVLRLQQHRHHGSMLQSLEDKAFGEGEGRVRDHRVIVSIGVSSEEVRVRCTVADVSYVAGIDGMAVCLQHLRHGALAAGRLPYEGGWQS